MKVPNMKKYNRLNYKSRVKIAFMLNKEHKNYSQIAKELGVSRNTISREVNLGKVNASKYVIYKKDKRFKLINNRFIYVENPAQSKKEERASKSRKKIKLDNNEYLYNKVEKQLKAGKKPDVISGLFKRRNEENDIENTYENTISHECIYSYIYSHEHNGWYEYIGVKQARKKRQKRSKRKTWLSNPDRKSIHERPSEANKREKAGHFEIDLMLGANGSKKAILTLYDRKARIGHGKFSNDKTSTSVYEKIKEIVNEIDGSKYIKSITADNGSEFAKYDEIEKELGIPVYFCDPYCSWQRGGNENFNGLLRRFFPKHKNFDSYTDEDLKEALDYWNNYERKILGYYSPNEIWEREFP
jgi:IS30 family transposase